MIYIGIDPGISGSIAVIRDGEVISKSVFDGPEYMRIVKEISESGEQAICALEKVSARPGQGVTSMFTFGTNYGWIQGVLSMAGIPFQLVSPNKWKKEFSITADKSSSVDACERLYPDVSLLRTEKCRKPDSNIAEAILLATYAKRRLS